MSVFTPSSKLSAETNPRDWTYEIGLLPQTASIVFTKSSLIAFLKTHGVEVGPNNSEISKLPRYATFGKMEDNIHSAPMPETKAEEKAPARITVTEKIYNAVTAPAQAPISAPAPVSLAPLPQQVVTTQALNETPASLEVRTPDGEVFRPTRRVREPIGGGSAQLGALFGNGSDDHDEIIREAEKEAAKRRGLAHQEVKDTTQAAPNTKVVQAPLQPSTAQNQQARTVDVEEKTSGVFRPTRRVREPGGTGGPSSFSLG